MRKLRLLIPSTIAIGLVGAVAMTTAKPPQSRAVSLTVHRVAQITNLDKDFDIKGPDRADFFANIMIAGQPTKTRVVSADDTRPYWVAMGKATSRYVQITVELKDDDGGIIENKDDVVDISPRADANSLHLTYDTFTGRISGDVRGYRKQILTSRGYHSPMGQIWFSIE